METDCKAGDLVRLKSGGPIMVIGEVDHQRREGDKGDTMLHCGWFGSSSKKFRTGSFPPETVEPASRADRGVADGARLHG